MLSGDTTSAARPALEAERGGELRRVGNVLDLVGNTPLLALRRITAGLSPRVKVYAKLEGFNPGGSVKDRAALWMVRDGIRSGRLHPGKTILDSTSGNTGIALAMVGAVLGYPVELVMPSNVSNERKIVLRAFGAKVIFSDPMEGSDGAIRLSREILKREGEKYFKPDQYFNEMNPRAHFESTGPEIWGQTGGAVTHFVAGLGTGGTIMGTGRYLKTRNPAVQVVGAEPEDAFHGLEGLKHMASSIVPGVFHEEELDRKVPIPTEAAYETVYRLGKEEGIVVGQSTGAAIWAALQVARDLDEGVLVAISPDFGDRYLSTNLWLGWREWLKRNGARVL